MFETSRRPPLPGDAYSLASLLGRSHVRMCSDFIRDNQQEVPLPAGSRRNIQASAEVTTPSENNDLARIMFHRTPYIRARASCVHYEEDRFRPVSSPLFDESWIAFVTSFSFSRSFELERVSMLKGKKKKMYLAQPSTSNSAFTFSTKHLPTVDTRNYVWRVKLSPGQRI